MTDTKTRWKRIGKNLLIAAGIAVAIFVAYKLAYFVAPLIVAFLLASLMEPLIKLEVKHFKFPRKLATALSLLIVIVVLGILLYLLFSRMITEIISLVKILPDYFDQFANTLDSVMIAGQDIYMWLPTQITDNIGNLITNFSDTLLDILNSILKGAFTTASQLPEIFLFVIATLLSTFFIASDREKISAFFKNQLPESWMSKISSLQHDMFAAFFGYVRAQLILMSITFAELLTGLTIAGVKYSLLIAFLTSILDALPIMGSGAVLIPWSLYSFIIGDIRLGIYLIVMYVIVILVRQLVEPRIVGRQIGIYPLLTVTAMYAGLKFLGVAGLILGPITVLVLKNIVTGLMNGKSLKDIVRQ